MFLPVRVRKAAVLRVLIQDHRVLVERNVQAKAAAGTRKEAI